jgi:hypothetical protein
MVKSSGRDVYSERQCCQGDFPHERECGQAAGTSAVRICETAQAGKVPVKSSNPEK